MAGTKLGAIKARDTNIKRHGEDFYSKIGSIGGKNGHTGGFYFNRELAKIAGARGGRISKRGKSLPKLYEIPVSENTITHRIEVVQL